MIISSHKEIETVIQENKNKSENEYYLKVILNSNKKHWNLSLVLDISGVKIGVEILQTLDLESMRGLIINVSKSIINDVYKYKSINPNKLNHDNQYSKQPDILIAELRGEGRENVHVDKNNCPKQQHKHYYPTPTLKYDDFPKLKKQLQKHHYPTPKRQKYQLQGEKEQDGELDIIDMDQEKSVEVYSIYVSNANYYSINTNIEFNDEINEFEGIASMVSPMVFNIIVNTRLEEGDVSQIEIVYRSNKNGENEILSNVDLEMTSIHTLFPSKNSNRTAQTKGGIQSIKLKKNNKLNKIINIELEVIFKDRNGRKYKYVQSVSLNHPPKEKIINDMIENDEDDTNENSFYLFYICH